MKPDVKKLLTQLVLHSALIIPLYFVLAAKLHFPYLHVIYLLAGAALGIIYVIYNRGFVAKNAKPEELPDRMSAEEKRAFREDGIRRARNSRWMLTLIIPIILTFLFDAAILYLFPSLEVILT